MTNKHAVALVAVCIFRNTAFGVGGGKKQGIAPVSDIGNDSSLGINDTVGLSGSVITVAISASPRQMLCSG
jgi:hypothetical protein